MKFSHMYQEIQEFYHEYNVQETKVENSEDISLRTLLQDPLYPTPPTSNIGAVRNLTPYFDQEDPELILPTINQQEFTQGFTGDVLTTLHPELEPSLFSDCLELTSDLNFPEWMENTLAISLQQY